MAEDILENRQKILLIDDESLIHEIIQNTFGWDYEVLYAENGEQGITLAQQDLPDVILLDVLLPDISGHKVLRRLKQHDETKNIPVIFLTGMSTLEDEVMGLEHGAKDFITKPFSPSIVKLRVEDSLVLSRRSRLLDAQAGQDELTGIASRVSFDEVFSKEWRRTKRNRLGLSLALVNIDDFALYEGDCTSGDKVLTSVALALDKAIHRPADLVARYAKEEFVVLLPDTGSECAKIVAERVRQSVAALQDSQLSSLGKPVSISIGGATMVVGEGGPEELLNSARCMLDRANEIGGDQIVWDD